MAAIVGSLALLAGCGSAGNAGLPGPQGTDSTFNIDSPPLNGRTATPSAFESNSSIDGPSVGGADVGRRTSDGRGDPVGPLPGDEPTSDDYGGAHSPGDNASSARGAGH